MDRWKIGGGPIFLTLQSPNMISVIDPVLCLHLQITTLEQVAIFNEITGIFSCFFVQFFLIKINRNLFNLLSKSDRIGLFKVSFNGIHFSFPGQLPRCGLPHKIERWAAFNCFEKFRRN